MERYAGFNESQIRLSMKKADLIEWFQEHKAPMPKGSGKEGRVLVRDLVEARKKFLAKGVAKGVSIRTRLAELRASQVVLSDRLKDRLRKHDIKGETLDSVTRKLGEQVLHVKALIWDLLERRKESRARSKRLPFNIMLSQSIL